MELAPITYELDEHEMPDHLFLSGALEIEICHIDEAPYIWAFDLDVWNEATQRKSKYHFELGQPDNHPNAKMLRDDLHRDTKLMDRIFDECRMAAADQQEKHNAKI